MVQKHIAISMIAPVIVAGILIMAILTATSSTNKAFATSGNTNLGFFNSGTGNIGFFNSGTGNIGFFNSGTGNIGLDIHGLIGDNPTQTTLGNTGGVGLGLLHKFTP
jgi:PPE-repeat protein